VFAFGWMEDQYDDEILLIEIEGDVYKFFEDDIEKVDDEKEVDEKFIQKRISIREFRKICSK